MNRARSAAAWLATAVIVSGAQAAPSEKANPIVADVEAFLADVRQLGIDPGLAITIVSGDDVLLDAGYGTADAESGRRATRETRFYLASSTKSLTALTVALLAHEGTLELTAPISRYLPSVELAAPLSADTITLRDLLTHQSGLSNPGSGWRTAYSGDYDSELLLRLIDDSTAREEGRAFAYTNYGYVVTGLILERRLKRSWHRTVRQKVLGPAGMAHTTSRPSEIPARHKAHPHAWAGGSHRLAVEKSEATMHPAGGHYSTSGDMARWLRLQLNDGMLGERRIFPEGVVASTHVPIAEVDREFFTYHRTGYGLGWYIADYRGETMLHHFGSYVGARAHVSFLPEHHVGVAVLMNDASPATFNLPDVIANLIYDRVLGREEASEARAAALTELAGAAERFSSLPTHGGAPIAHPARYAGSYHSPTTGTVVLSVEEGRLVARMGALASPVTHYRDTAALRWELIPLQGQRVEVIEDDQGGVTAISFRGTEFARLR